MSLRLVPPEPFEQPERFVRGEYLIERPTVAANARYDLPYDEWVALPEATLDHSRRGLLGQPSSYCPLCGHNEWGAINPRGYVLVYCCHGCGARFRGVDGVHHDERAVALEIVFAWLGYRRCFAIDRAPKVPS